MPDDLLPQTAHLLIHLLVTVLVPPFLLGVINRVKSVIAGRQGPPLLQLYWDLGKLWRKGSVFSTTTTWMFRAGAVAAIATGLVAAMLIPLGHHHAPLAFTGDLVLFAYLLGLSRFLTATSALDTGSAFEGMGVAREITFAALTEPALFLGLAALVSFSGSMSLDTMLPAAGCGWGVQAGPLLLVLAGWIIVLLVENCRIPFDDPNTHLELTMIHEVMVLDHSGPSFACVLYGASLKLFVLAALVVGLCLPTSGDPWLDWLTFLAALVAVAVGIGLVESSMARLRMPRVPQLLVAATLACAFGFLLMLV